MRGFFLMAPGCAVKIRPRPACSVTLTGRQLRPPNPESNPRQFDASPRAAGTPGAGAWAALMRVRLRRPPPVPAVAAGRASSPPLLVKFRLDPLAVQAFLASLARPGAPGDPTER